MSKIQDKFWRALDRARGARVPSGDRANSTVIGPVTLSGYYLVETKSGRPAWAFVTWGHGDGGGFTHEQHCTYRPDAEQLCNDLVLAGADPFLVQP